MIDKKMSAEIEKVNKIVQNKIQMTLVESQYEDIVFSEIYQFINPTLKKKTIEKALISFLKKSSDEVLEIYFGDNLEEAKKVAKKRAPRARKPTTKRTIKKKVVESKLPMKDIIPDEKEEIEEILPNESAKEEEIIAPEIVIETPEIEVMKDDISSDEEIWNILNSHNTCSSTTEESEGSFEELKLKRKKKEEEKTKLEEPTKEELEARKNELIEIMEKRTKESEERKKENTVKWK